MDDIEMTKEQTKELEQFISVKTTADLLDCTIQFVYHLIGTGNLKAIKLGTQAIRISVKSLNEYIEKQWIDPTNYRCEEMETDRIRKPAVVSKPVQSNWMKRSEP